MSTATKERETTAEQPRDRYLADVWATARGQRGNEPPTNEVLFGCGRFVDQFSADADRARDRLRAAADLARADVLEHANAMPQGFSADRPLSDFGTLGELAEALTLLHNSSGLRIEDQLAESNRKSEVIRLRSTAKRVLCKTAAKTLHDLVGSLSEQRKRLRENILPENDAAEIERLERQLGIYLTEHRRAAAVETRQKLADLRSPARQSELVENCKANAKARKEIAKIESEIAAVENRMLDPEAMELTE